MKKLTFLLSMAATLWAACGKKENTVYPHIKNLTEAVYASGNIYPKNEYQVFANADGLLDKVYVEEGDQVMQGQPLFKIESDMQDAKYQSSRAIFSTARSNYGEESPSLAEARAAMETAKSKKNNDSINYIRYQNLYQNNATSKVELEKAKLSYEVSSNDFISRINALEKLRRQLYIDLQNAESQFKVNEKEGKNFSIKALLDGMVYEVYKEKGEAVRRNDPIALIGDLRDSYIQLAVDELDIEKVKPGQEVLIKVDLYKDKIFKGTVLKIHKKLNEKDQSFQVDAAFTGEKPSHYYGLTVEANIIVNSKKNVLVIPKNLLIGSDSVMVKVNGEKRKVKINKGIEDFDFVEVISGIDKNTSILLQ